MSTNVFSFSADARYEIYLENKRVERCLVRRAEALKRRAEGKVVFTTEQQVIADENQRRMAAIQERKWLD